MTGRAILFLQLGGPESPADVRGFLYRLFSDPEVIRVRSGPGRHLIAAAIAAARTGTSKKMYRAIGGGSPIRRLTDAQSAGVEKLLCLGGHDVLVRTAMTCARPLVEDVVQELAAQGVTRWMSFPLYPQYSLTTTKGSHDRSRRAVERYSPGSPRPIPVGSFPTHPLLLRAHAELIRKELREFPDPTTGATLVLFSAHSIPRKLVTHENDPYQREAEATVAGVTALLGDGVRARLAYQSRLGPVEWLGPATKDVLTELGRKGEKQVLVVPISFVTDHIETLYELDLLLKPLAESAGVKHFRRTPGLNEHPLFLECLKEMALAQDGFWK